MTSNKQAAVLTVSRSQSTMDIVLALTLCAVILDEILKLATGVVLAMGGLNSTLIYVGMVGAYALVVPAILMVFLRPGFRASAAESRILRPIIIAVLAGALYFTIGLFSGFLLGQAPKDVIGSTGRALMPFIVMVCVFNGLSRSRLDARDQFFRYFMITGILFTLLGGIGKLLLLSDGYFYGAGLSQFDVRGAVLAWSVLYIFKTRPSRRAAILVASVTVVLVFLSVLSFKREVWIGLLFTGVLLALPLLGRQRIVAAVAVLALVATGIMLLSQWGQLSRVVARYDSTFSGSPNSGSAGLDVSSYTRVAEAEAAYHTLNHSPLGLGWVTGLGPGAGYDNPKGFYFTNLNSRGQPYHIHSALALITFRYGLTGLILYMWFVGWSSRVLFRFSRELKRSRHLSPMHPMVLGFCGSVGIVGNLPGLLVSNVYFGSVEFGMLVGMVAYGLVSATVSPSLQPSGERVVEVV